MVSLDKATEAVSTHKAGGKFIANTVMENKGRTENDNTKGSQLDVEGNHKTDKDIAVGKLQFCALQIINLHLHVLIYLLSH